jgi:uncharacterized protein YndB with AHSA1/START domain
MPSFQESITIKCPVEKVFAYAIQVKHWPDWQTVVREAEQTSQGPWGVGTTAKGVSHMMGLTSKWTVRITEYEPNRRYVKQFISPGVVMVEQVAYDPAGDGMKLSITYDISAHGFMKLFESMIVSSMHKETAKSLAKLKGILEAQA